MKIQLGAVLVMLLTVPVSAGDQVAGVIASFECGDNCYLTIASERGTDLTGLCAAEACWPWSAQGAIPDDLVGHPVRATVGVGDQLDGNGDVVGPFVAFTEIELQ